MCKVVQKVVISFLASVFLSCSMIRQSDEKINGVSFVASGEKVTEQHTTPVVRLNANYAAVMPFGFMKNLQSPIVNFNSDRQWFGERADGVAQYITELHNSNIKTMLKPQIWVSKGEFTGKIKMESEQDWLLLEKKYTDFILTYAKVAHDNKVAIYCIGTELELFVKQRPDYWNGLIQQVKAIYKGKITYAANWDEYPKTTFWNELDYIGIDGYFPLSDAKTPEVSILRKKWQKHKLAMKKHADSLQKKILFTEFGYRSVDFAAAKPWEVDYNKTSVNLKGQVNATQALFDELWHENWFAGGFVWKWFIDYEKSGGVDNPRFTPQNKPAEDLIRSFYLKVKD